MSKNILFHPLVAALLIVLLLSYKFDVTSNPRKLIIIYFSIAALMLFFNKSNKLADTWNLPSGLFNGDI